MKKHLILAGGLNQKGDDTKKDIANVAAFMGYQCDRFRVGTEYNYMTNTSDNDNADQNGYSIFGSVKVAKFADLYARFDDLNSENDWNISKDERAAILGAQFKLGKYVKIAPNFRMSVPKDGSDNIYYAYINCYFGL